MVSTTVCLRVKQLAYLHHSVVLAHIIVQASQEAQLRYEANTLQLTRKYTTKKRSQNSKGYHIRTTQAG